MKLRPRVLEWLEELPQKAHIYSLAFVQLGHAAADVRRALPGISGTHLDIEDYLAEERSGLASPIFLYDFDRMRKNRGHRLGELRDRVMREALGGACFVFVSASPKTAYPDTRGSDVIADAKQVFAPSLAPTSAAAEEAAPTGAVWDDAASCVSCVRELGERTVIALSEAMWESHLSLRAALESLTRPDVEALRGAGLVEAEGADLTWCLSNKQLRNVKSAVAQVCSESQSAADSVAASFVEVWVLERELRNVIRTALMDKMKDSWRENCLPVNLRNDVLERARRDTQPGATKLADLRDPLEWLSTTELLDLREARELGGLGLEPFMWTKLRNEIVPIRNKIAHMRLVSEHDVQRATMWRQVVVQRTGKKP